MTVIYLPEAIKTISSLLDKAGFESFIVGGCVRDSLLNKNPKDWDMCTNATPEQMKKVLMNYKTIDTGIKHGTITVHTDSMDVEVTTYRIDGNYSDGRHPDDITFTSDLIEDLSRRDFTINAMAYNDKVGLVDPFDGKEDLYNGILSCVGNANTRLNEDGLRILRAIRFALKYQLRLDSDLEEAIIDNLDLLLNISRERIHNEIKQILRYTYKQPQLLKSFKEVMLKIFPQLTYANYEYTIDLISLFKECTEETIFLSCLVWDIDSSKDASQLLKSLKLDSDTFNKVLQLHQYRFYNVANFTEYQIKDLLRKIGYTQFYTLNVIQEVHHQVLINNISKVSSRITDIIENNECYRLDQLDIKGDDIKSLGIEEGPMIGYALEDCIRAVTSEKINNKKLELLEYIKKEYKNVIVR